MTPANKISKVMLFFFILFICLSNSYGQEKKIYIVKTKSKLTQEQISADLLDFVTYFTKLKLESSGKYVTSVVQEDPCDASKVQSEAQNNFSSQAEQNNYVVRVTVGSFTAKELSIDYELISYNKNCYPNFLVNEKKPFIKKQVLDDLSEITSNIVSTLEKDIGKNNTNQKDNLVLDNFDIRTSNAPTEVPTAFKNELTDKFFEELAKNNITLRTSNSSTSTNSAYKIEVEVVVTRNNKGISQITSINPNIYIPSGVVPVDVSPLTKPIVVGEQVPISEQIKMYFSDVAKMTTEELVDIYYNTSNVDKVQLLKDALTFMCLKDDYLPLNECIKQPKSAIPLLRKLIRLQGSNVDPKLWQILGEAKLTLDDYAGAIKDFQTAFSKVNIESKEIRIYLLNKLAYALYKNEAFDEAAKKYEESLKLDNKQQEIHVQKITNYIFAKTYKQAIDSAVDSLRDLSDLPQNSSTIKNILVLTSDTINKLQELGELEGVKSLLDSSVATLPVLNEVLYQTNALITKKLYFLIEEELQKAQPNTKKVEPFLQTVETLKSNLPNIEKERLEAKYLYLNAIILREKKDFQKAEENLLKSLSIKDVEQLKDLQIDSNNQAIVLELAKVYNLYAENNKEEKFNKQASKILELLVNTDPPKEAYFLLYKVNNSLGNDKETKNILESLVSKNRDNAPILLKSQEILTNYLYDFSTSSNISEELEKIRKQDKNQAIFPLMDLGIIEGYVLDEKFNKAVKYINETLNAQIKDTSLQSPPFLSTLYFYKTWCEIEMKDEQNVIGSEKQWKTWLEKVSQESQLPYWFFRGAKYLLDKQDPSKTLKLKNMLETMFKHNPSTFRQL